MKVLVVDTSAPSLRAEIWGWGEEDSDLFVRNKPIGLTPGPKHYYTPKTVLEALADGWKLLGPPFLQNVLSALPNDREFWSWWLIKD